MTAQSDPSSRALNAAGSDSSSLFQANAANPQQSLASTPKFGYAVLRLRSDNDVRRNCQPHIRRDEGQVGPKLRDAMRDLVHGDAPWPLFLYGDVGVGKTCAALCLCDRATSADYWTARELHALAIGAPGPIWEWWSGSVLAVLDELGRREKESAPMCDTLQRCLDDRQGKPTIYIAQVGLDQIALAYDDRIASRLAAGTPYHLSGPDRRIANE